MNEIRFVSRHALLVLDRRPSAPTVHSLEETAHIVGIHPERLRHYGRIGVGGPPLTNADGEPVFDDDRLYELRRFEHFRRRHRVNPPTLRLLGELWRELEHLRAELRFLRLRQSARAAQ